MKNILSSILFIVLIISFMSHEDVSARTYEAPSTNILQPRKGVSGTIQIHGITYKWIETSWGKNRGMTFNPGNKVYQMSPNPHDDPWYNKHQEKFYNQAAVAIKGLGDVQKWTSTTWPLTINGVVVNGVTYYLKTR
ncbi:hypothetical protein QUO97_002320 [Enterococcus faecalis]|nr:hypothetical protein [Enterococcus faecalis]ELT8947889.1 hypothetical protein [Enterococcus faecalis]